MMKIAICDDEKEFRDLIRVYIEDYLNTKDILYTIDTFISGEKFLNETFPSEYSIIFLDINMEGMDGITTAKKIREDRKPEHDVVGSEAMQTLRKYHFTKGFFGTNGVTKKAGFTTPDANEAMVKKTAREQCQKKVSI